MHMCVCKCACLSLYSVLNELVAYLVSCVCVIFFGMVGSKNLVMVSSYLLLACVIFEYFFVLACVAFGIYYYVNMMSSDNILIATVNCQGCHATPSIRK